MTAGEGGCCSPRGKWKCCRWRGGRRPRRRPLQVPRVPAFAGRLARTPQPPRRAEPDGRRGGKQHDLAQRPRLCGADTWQNRTNGPWSGGRPLGLAAPPLPAGTCLRLGPALSGGLWPSRLGRQGHEFHARHMAGTRLLLVPSFFLFFFLFFGLVLFYFEFEKEQSARGFPKELPVEEGVVGGPMVAPPLPGLEDALCPRHLARLRLCPSC